MKLAAEGVRRPVQVIEGNFEVSARRLPVVGQRQGPGGGLTGASRVSWVVPAKAARKAGTHNHSRKKHRDVGRS